jgi:hypothetical protein
MIRFSLASLGALVSSEIKACDAEKNGWSVEKSFDEVDNDELGMDLGLVFITATAPPPLPKFQRLRNAFLFVESLPDLTSAVVSTPMGSSSRTECGLMPALLNTVSVNPGAFVGKMITMTEISEFEGSQIKSILRYIAAQAVQILEGAIVKNGNALSAFHNLLGKQMLTDRLMNEIMTIREEKESSYLMIRPEPWTWIPRHRWMLWTCASQRVLLFGVVTCLTVVCHQESTAAIVTAPSGSSELRKP